MFESGGTMVNLIASIPAVLVAFAVHGYAEARMAVHCGDDTPRQYGKDTLNPFTHMDLMGLAMMILVHFGWGKGVPINPYNLKNPKFDMVKISFAGFGANVVVAFIAYGVLYLSDSMSYGAGAVLSRMVLLNINLGLISLLPLPPLVGYRMIAPFLPEGLQRTILMNPFMCMILLVFLVYSGVISGILSPVYVALLGLFETVFGLVQAIFMM